MPGKEFLLEQIARAKRFAAGLTSKDDQETFQKIAADYQSQLDATEAAAPTTAPEISSEATAPSNDAPPTTTDGVTDAIAPQRATSTDDQEPTTG
jgi:hypothetical protein